MRKVLTIFSVFLFFVLPATSQATIVSINANFLDTYYTANSGELSICDSADIVVEDTSGSQTTYTQGSFNLSVFLQNDTSSGGIASGLFDGGTIVFQDGSNNDLLTGDSVSMSLTEIFDGSGMLGVIGQFVVTGGSLETDFALPHGNIVQITFNISPATISDFLADFSGTSNITVVPVPEPATIALLALGGLLLRRKKVRKLC